MSLCRRYNDKHSLHRAKMHRAKQHFLKVTNRQDLTIHKLESDLAIVMSLSEKVRHACVNAQYRTR